MNYDDWKLMSPEDEETDICPECGTNVDESNSYYPYCSLKCGML